MDNRFKAKSSFVLNNLFRIANFSLTEYPDMQKLILLFNINTLKNYLDENNNTYEVIKNEIEEFIYYETEVLNIIVEFVGVNDIKPNICNIVPI